MSDSDFNRRHSRNQAVQIMSRASYNSGTAFKESRGAKVGGVKGRAKRAKPNLSIVTNTSIDENEKMFISPGKNSDFEDSDEERPPPVGENMAHLTKSVRERSLQTAQETLNKLLDDGQSDVLIENQVNAVEKLRLRLRSLKRPNKSGNLTTTKRLDIGEHQVSKPYSKPGENVRTATGCMFIPGLNTDAISTGSNSENEAISESDFRTSKKRGKPAKKRKANEISSPTAALRTAFPISHPRSLPQSLRLDRMLSPDTVAARSRIHSTFDESKTKKIDRHIRKINTTNAPGRQKQLPERTLESRIGIWGLTDSDEDNGSTGGDRADNRGGTGADLETLKNIIEEEFSNDFRRAEGMREFEGLEE